MAYSKSHMEASNRYRTKAYDCIQITVPKGMRDVYKSRAAAQGLSLNSYIVQLLSADSAQPQLEEQSPRDA